MKVRIIRMCVFMILKSKAVQYGNPAKEGKIDDLDQKKETFGISHTFIRENIAESLKIFLFLWPLFMAKNVLSCDFGGNIL